MCKRQIATIELKFRFIIFYYFKKLHHQHSEFTSENKEFTIKEKKKSCVDKQNREEIMKNHLTQLLGRKMGKKSFKFALHFLPSTPTTTTTPTNSFLFFCKQNFYEKKYHIQQTLNE